MNKLNDIFEFDSFVVIKNFFVVIENFFVNKSNDIFKFNFFVVIENFFVNKLINIFKFKTFFVDKKFFKIKSFSKRRKIIRIFISKKNKTF